MRNRPLNSIRRFARRSKSERALFLKAFLLLSSVRTALWVLSFNRLCKLFAGRDAQRGTASSNANASVQDVVWAVTAASRYVPGATCLTQAVAAQRLLTQSGHDAAVTI